MLLSAAVWLALSATPSIAVSDLSRVNVSPELGAFAADHVGQVLGARGFKVISQNDVKLMLSLERQKELLGCTEGASSCTAELAQALGVDTLLTGTIARLGNTLQLNLRMVDARTGGVRARWSGSVRDEGELPQLLSTAADVLADAMGQPAAPPTATASTSPGQSSALPWVVAAVGVAVAAGGAVSLGLAEQAHASLRAPSSEGVLDEMTAATTRDRGKALQIAAPIMLGVGAAAVVTGIILKLRATPAAPTVALGVSPSNAALVVSGRF
jgi:TolB-like protein